jgi:hypothetical protein
VQDASNDIKKDLMKLERDVKQKQKESTFIERAQWVTGERERFLELLEELTGHNDYFVSILVLRTYVQRNEHRASSQHAVLPTQITSVASHLQQLIRSMGATEASNRIFFHMMLMDSPFELRLKIGGDMPASALLRQSSSMFAFKLLEKPFGDTTSETTHQNDIISLLFEVPSHDHSNEDLEQQIEAERPQIKNFATKFLPIGNPENETEDPESRPWWAAIGTIKSITSRPQRSEPNPIAVFHDRHVYIRSKTLLQSFVDPEESKIIGKTYLIYRIRLAFTLASSFMHFILAGYPMEYLSQSLFYYNDSTSQLEPFDTLVLAERSIYPYVQLRAIGAFPSSKSFSSLLSGSVESASKDQIMVQQLGVLLCEVGRWKPISSAKDWRSRASAARIQKTDLIKCVTVGYFNVVHSCLEFTPQDVWTNDAQVVWLNANVVQPLRHILNSLPPEFQLT